MIGIYNDIYKSLFALKYEILSVGDFYDLQNFLKVVEIPT